MQTIKKQKPVKKNVAIAVSLVIVLVVIGIAAYYFLRQPTIHSNTAAPVTSTSNQQNTINYGPPTEEQKQESTDQKQKAADQNTPSPSQTPTDSNIHISISRDGQTKAGQPLNIRTVITGISSGTCTITLTKDGQPTVTKTFTIVYQATYATCENADIPASSFSTSGSWNLSIIAQSGSAISPAATDTVNIEK